MIFEILDHQRGIPSKRKSAACVDYVPAPRTHRPPIEWFSENFGLELSCSAILLFSNGAREAILTGGSKSRNKVSVGEPAEGSLLIGFSALLCAPFSARSSVSRPGGGSGGEWVRVGGRAPSPPAPRISFFVFFSRENLKFKQLLTVDPSARASMKNAANCDV